MWEIWIPSLGWEDALEKGNATHSSILAWRIPWTVQSIWLQRVRHKWVIFIIYLSIGNYNFPGVSVVTNLPSNAGDAGLIPASGRSTGKGNGNPLQYSYLGNPMDRGTWWATVHGIAKRVRNILATKTTFINMCVCVCVCVCVCITLLDTWN